MYHIFCIHSSIEGHLGSFQLLAIINRATMNIVEHVSLLPVGTSSGYMSRRSIAGSFSSTMSNSCICSSRWPSRPSLGREAPWSCKFYMPQYRGMPGPKSESGWVGEQGRKRVKGTFGIAFET